MPTIAQLPALTFDAAALPATKHGPLVGEVQARLRKLNKFLSLPAGGIAKGELSRKEIGRTTEEALRVFQGKYGLTITGRLDKPTLDKLNGEMEHEFIAQSRSRTQRLHLLLQQAGHQLDAAELRDRRIGNTTLKAIHVYEPKERLNAQVLEQIEKAAFTKRMGSLLQCANFHRLITSALTTAKIAGIQISADEVNQRKYGLTTKAATSALQKKYKLKQTNGDMTQETYDLLLSLKTSIPNPVRLVKPGNFSDLTLLPRRVRLNQVGPQVQALQKALAALGHPPSQSEYDTSTFGKTTRAALLAYQRSQHLPESGQIDPDCRPALNAEINRLNPKAAQLAYRCRVRGSVRDPQNDPVKNATIEIWKRPIKPGDSPLATKKTGKNGFYDLPYAPPARSPFEKPHRPQRLIVRAIWPSTLASAQTPSKDLQVLSAPRTLWANFTLADWPHWSINAFEQREKAISWATQRNAADWANDPSLDLAQINEVAKQTKLTDAEILQYLLAVRAAIQTTQDGLSAETWFCFTAQNQPTLFAQNPNGYPYKDGDQAVEACLLGWSKIATIIIGMMAGLAFMSSTKVHQILVAAERLRLCRPQIFGKTRPPANQGNKKRPWTKRPCAIERNIATFSNEWILKKHVLADGNAIHPGIMTLKEFLDELNPPVPQLLRAPVINKFRTTRGFNAAFWHLLPAGQDTTSLKEKFHFARIASFSLALTNHFLANKEQNTLKEMFCRKENEWSQIIRGMYSEGGHAKPQSEINRQIRIVTDNLNTIFPGAAFWREIQQQKKSELQEEDQKNIWKTLNDLNFDLLTSPIKDASAESEKKLVDYLRALQRVHRLSPTPAIGVKLWANHIRSAQQVIILGVDRLARTLGEQGDKATAVYELARIQYAKALKFLLGKWDVQDTGSRVLVGLASADTVDVPHADSVFGPPAYLADLLRYLSKHFAKGALTAYDSADVICRVYATRQEGSIPLFRYAKSSAHYCTTDQTNHKNLIADDFKYDGIIGYVPNVAEGGISLYRFKSRTTNDYAYSINPSDFAGTYEHREKVARVFSVDANKPGTAPLYQLTKAGPPVAHFCTASAAERDNLGGQTVLDVLLQRRPDIAHVHLNQPNTETPLPYIDLVCEILENAVATGQPTSSFAFQTTWSADRLRAQPEHVNANAYETLATRPNPLKGTFNLWQEQVRLQLEQLKAPRWQLIEIWRDPLQQNSHAASQSAPDPHLLRHWAAEYWGLTGLDADMLCQAGPIASAALCTHWGLEEATPPNSIPISRLMALSGLTYAQVMELRDCDQWLLLPPFPTITSGAVQDADHQQLEGLETSHWDRILRLVSLQRHTAWSLTELDELLALEKQVGGDNSAWPNADTLSRLMQLDRLQKRFDLDLNRTQLLGWGILSTRQPRRDPQATRRDRSFYERLLRQQEPVSDPKGIKADATQIQTAFNLNTMDLLAAWNLCATTTETNPSEALTAKSWSREEVAQIGRLATLARCIGKPVGQVIQLLKYAGGPALVGKPISILNWMDSLQLLETSAASLPDLCYWLGDPGSPLAPTDKAVDQQVQIILDELKNLQASVPTTSTGTTEGPAGTTAAASPDKQDAGESPRALALDAALAQWLDMPGPQARALRISIKGFNAFIEQTANGSTDRLNERQDELAGCLQLIHKAAHLLGKLQASGAEADWLLNRSKAHPLFSLADVLPKASACSDKGGNAFRKILDLFRWRELKTIHPDIDERTNWITAIDAMNSAAGSKAPTEQISSLLKFDANETTKLVRQLGFNWPQPGLEMSHLVQLERCVGVAKAVRAPVDILEQLTETLLPSEQSQAKDEKLAEQMDAVLQRAYAEPEWLAMMTPMQDILRERKRDALLAHLLRWSNSGHLDSKPLNPRWKDADDVLAHYLIDVQMSACQATSRIKQAISSTQMFVQRCLLGHERDWVVVSEAAKADEHSDHSWRQWKWMKNYRIWEANRKVFLFPENWVDPTLRVEKTPFFEELENELLQSDLDDAAAEQALANYLQKLHHVSRLEPVAAHQEDRDEAADQAPSAEGGLLHVLARTSSEPTTYFYRTRELMSGHWTPWESLELDIQGKSIALTTYNRRLYLFWLEIIEKPQKLSKTPVPPVQQDGSFKTEPGDAPEVPSQLEIKLCWSSRRGKTWSPKQISQQTLIHPWTRPLDTYNLRPRHAQWNNQLWLDVFISQSRVFNEGLFWDCYENGLRPLTKRTRYEATARPWHSSSFVFDGQVADVYLRPLTADYRLPASKISDRDRIETIDSLDLVRSKFRGPAAHYRPLRNFSNRMRSLPLPAGMIYCYNHLVTTASTRPTTAFSILERGQSRTLLSAAPAPSRLISSQKALDADGSRADVTGFFQSDGRRSYYLEAKVVRSKSSNGQELLCTDYTSQAFYHPHSSLFIREVNRLGIPGLLNRKIQISPESYPYAESRSIQDYKPNQALIRRDDLSPDVVDFGSTASFSIYNWELFFHIPFLIACRLSDNQRFEDSLRWFHYIFDPTNGTGTQGAEEGADWRKQYWITKPFHEQASGHYIKQGIDYILSLANSHAGSIAEWRNNPFQPHVVAAQRPVAYQRAVLLRYIDNLIAWGDQLFLRDTIESLNEATTLYVLASELLGRRPVRIQNGESRPPQSYAKLVAQTELDAFSNATGSPSLDELAAENSVSPPTVEPLTSFRQEPLPILSPSYFQNPGNENLQAYWTKLSTRFFNLRNCRNFEGVKRQLPLFEPPIDPALLVRAAAAGLDISQLAGTTTQRTHYRFLKLLQKANEVCSEVRSLGEKLLAALEKKDGEALASLRSAHEIRLLEATRSIKAQQIKETKESLKGLEISKANAQQRHDYYDGLEFRNEWETAALGMSMTALGVDIASQSVLLLAGAAESTPNVEAGAAGACCSPVATVQAGGPQLAGPTKAIAETLGKLSLWLDKSASIASTIGGHHRRQDEWRFMAKQAATEVRQFERQIAASEIRLAIVERELENHELQVQQTRTADEFLKNKFTSQQLYNWQVQQLAALYFQAYKQALDTAREAEHAYRLETCNDKASFIQPGHWDGLRRGLLAGDKLAADLRRMELGFMKQNKRRFEITKSIALSRLDAAELLKLKHTGSCSFHLSKELMDADFPDHSNRRIKSAALTIPAVVGPYTGVNAELRLCVDGKPVDSIVTSHAANDAGMFEPTLNDDRYLPFEGYQVEGELTLDSNNNSREEAGSWWTVNLPAKNNGFDTTQISDVILSLRYTAEPGTANTAPPVQTSRSGSVLLKLSTEFSSAWQAARKGEGDDFVMSFSIEKAHLPYLMRKPTVTVERLAVLMENSAANPISLTSGMSATIPSEGSVRKSIKLKIDSEGTDASIQRVLAFPDPADNGEALFPIGTWTLQISGARDSSGVTTLQEVYLALVLKDN
jgi:peptidoglycan hydrolase-like protein with peptidoglycan-binding domain